MRLSSTDLSKPCRALCQTPEFPWLSTTEAGFSGGGRGCKRLSGRKRTSSEPGTSPRAALLCGGLALGVGAQLGEGGSEEETSPGAPWAATAAHSCRRPAGSLQDAASGLVNEPRRNFHTSLVHLESQGLLAVAPRMPSFACCLRPLVT